MEFNKTLDMLLDESGSLVELARKSGLDAFTFYQGADFRGINLSNQDLSGLNFKGADFRSADLTDIKYDAGAFNGAVMSPIAESLMDAFEYYVEDLNLIWEKGLYIFGKFRPISLEYGIDLTKLTYEQFARKCEINLSTLRKARRGGVVSGDTLNKICCNLIDGWQTRLSSDSNQNELFDVLKITKVRQPFIELLNLNSDGGNFSPIPREMILEIFENHSEILKEIFDPQRDGMRYNFNTMMLFKDISEKRRSRGITG